MCINSELPAKTRRTALGVLHLFRHEEALMFVCVICSMRGGGQKRSRLSAIWITTSGKQHRICNGCYSSLVGVSKGSGIKGHFLEAVSALL